MSQINYVRISNKAFYKSFKGVIKISNGSSLAKFQNTYFLFQNKKMKSKFKELNCYSHLFNNHVPTSFNPGITIYFHASDVKQGTIEKKTKDTYCQLSNTNFWWKQFYVDIISLINSNLLLKKLRVWEKEQPNVIHINKVSMN